MLNCTIALSSFHIFSCAYMIRGKYIDFLGMEMLPVGNLKGFEFQLQMKALKQDTNL